MTFELSQRHQAARDRARVFAREVVTPQADAIDRSGQIPAAILADAEVLPAASDLVTVVVVVEELAAASAAAALAVALGVGVPASLAGLRGAPEPDRSPRAQVVLTAAALGVGRAALDQAIADLRESSAHPGGDEKPHWAVADAATELDAARLLTFKAAAAPAGERHDAEIAMARLLTASAARHAIDVALRLGGSRAFESGSLLDRLSRDARALALVGGGEEQLRGTAAAGILPE